MISQCLFEKNFFGQRQRKLVKMNPCIIVTDCIKTKKKSCSIYQNIRSFLIKREKKLHKTDMKIM